MSRTPDEARRSELLDRAVDYVLAHGLSDLSLRPLAKALGSSPRVLLYYFGSKDDLLVQIIRRGRARQQATMASMKLSTDLSAGQITRLLWRHYSDPKRMPLMNLFFEVYALAIADPSRFPNFLEGAVEEWLIALEGCSTLPGFSRDEARAFATILIASFRGFMLDLAATNDRKRIDRAVEMWLSMLDTSQAGAQSRDATA